MGLNKNANDASAKSMKIQNAIEDKYAIAYHTVNIKLPPEKVLDLIDRVHFYPAYHMNKKHWITIVLDKEVDEPLVQQLLEESYGLVEKLIK